MAILICFTIFVTINISLASISILMKYFWMIRKFNGVTYPYVVL